MKKKILMQNFCLNSILQLQVTDHTPISKISRKQHLFDFCRKVYVSGTKNFQCRICVTKQMSLFNRNKDFKRT